MKLHDKIKHKLSIQKAYYENDRREIASENLTVLLISGAGGLATALLLFIIAPEIIPSWSITREYYLVFPPLIGAFIFALFFRLRGREPKPLVVEIACALFYILLLTAFIALSTFPYPNTPQIYISLCFMFMPSLLILRPWQLLSIMYSAELVFILLISHFKTDFAIENDIFNTIASLVFSFIIMSVINRLRYRNFAARTKLQKLSQTDALTGLLNKSSFEDSCNLYLSHHSAHTPAALLILDLDDFKKVNDSFGHPFGDLLLTACGEALSRVFRQSDYLGRIGGDEFAVLMPSVHDRELIQKKCELIKESFHELTVDGRKLRTSCSIGAVIAPGDRIVEYTEMFRSADRMLYQVKRSGKSSYRLKYLS